MSVDLLTVREVASILGVSGAMVYKLNSTGKLVGYRISEGTIRFSREEVDEYIKSVKGGTAKVIVEADNGA